MTSFEGNKASFICVAPGIIYWKINGTFREKLPPSIKRDVSLHDVACNSVLHITARPQYNGTVVQCLAERDIGGSFISATSKRAYLHIQGTLGAVNMLQVENGLNSITVSWSAPFSLDVSGVDPDILYTVLISNVTEEDHPTAVPCTDCHNLTQTLYIFSPELPSPCHKYSFTVITQNEAGLGQSSKNLKGYIVQSIHSYKSYIFIISFHLM